MELFHPPGNVDDLNVKGKANWHAWMSAMTAYQRASLVCELRHTHASASSDDLSYVDPRDTPVPADAEITGLGWNGFPNALKRTGDLPAAWAAADVVEAVSHVYAQHGDELPQPERVNQDEYVEWHADSDKHGVYRVSLTCEPPDYWRLLAAQDDLQTVHALYEDFLGHAVPIEDLRYPFDAYETPRSKSTDLPVVRQGEYNPFNKWNTTDGAVHLTQANNTLGAEVNLAARATVPRLGLNDRRLKLRDELICCAGYGEPSRDSDPSIGATANGAAASGKLMTLTDPVGLYMSDFKASLIELPPAAGVPANNPDPSKWWKCTRGEERSADGKVRMVRIVYRIPEGATMPDGNGGVRPLRLGDLSVNQEQATHGGALAQLITMNLYVSSWDDPQKRSPLALHCSLTCCLGRNDRLTLCEQENSDLYPNLFAESKRSPQCTDQERGALFREVFGTVLEEALAEASEVLGAVGAFEANDPPELIDSPALKAYAFTTRSLQK